MHKHAAFAKPLPKTKIKKVKNQKPEYDLVVHPCLIWLKAQGFSVDIYESRAVWDNRAHCYVSKGLKAGHPDMAGCSPNGYAMYIECKSPGKRASLKEHQRAFLAEKIEHGAFSCVIDSLELLQGVWAKWIALRADGNLIEAKKFLLTILPKSKFKEEFNIE